MKYLRDNINFMTSNPTGIGEWIRIGLREINQNQVWLAEKIGVQPPQVSRIISGSSEAPPDILAAIADALGKPRIQAFRVAGYIEKVANIDEEIELILHEVEKLPKADREEVLAFIRMKNNLRKKK